MNDDEAIRMVCCLLEEEAEAVASYTDKIALATEMKEKDIAIKLEEIRIDEVEHIQKLCIMLTQIATRTNEKAEEVAENMEVQNEN